MLTPPGVQLTKLKLVLFINLLYAISKIFVALNLPPPESIPFLFQSKMDLMSVRVKSFCIN